MYNNRLPSPPPVCCRVWKCVAVCCCVFQRDVYVCSSWWSDPCESRESCHTWQKHVTHMNESCHIYEWVMSHPACRDTWPPHTTPFFYSSRLHDEDDDLRLDDPLDKPEDDDVCLCACVRVCVRVCKYATCVWVCICIYIYIYIYLSIHVYI